jgi:hypothetical protein
MSMAAASFLDSRNAAQPARCAVSKGELEGALHLSGGVFAIADEELTVISPLIARELEWIERNTGIVFPPLDD